MDEYISRKAALKKLDHFQSYLHTVEGIHAVGVAKTLISEIPAADVRPVVRGRWIEHYEHYDTGEEQREAQYGYVCSVCGRWEYEKEPFCNCGADMEEQDG